VLVWDAARGVELCLLRGDGERVHCVLFSPDGTLLAWAGTGRGVHIADARPWTPANAFEREARGLVESLFTRPLLKADVLARIRDHKGISETVRQQGLELAGRSQDNADRFRRAARGVVRYRDAAPALYREALGWAQTACRLADDDGPSRTTLGIAEFRLGQYAGALATLTRALQLNETHPAELAPDLAFLALVHHRLGHPGEARAARGRLTELMKTSPADWSEETRQYVAEVESVLGKAGDGGK